MSPRQEDGSCGLAEAMAPKLKNRSLSLKEASEYAAKVLAKDIAIVAVAGPPAAANSASIIVAAALPAAACSAFTMIVADPHRTFWCFRMVIG